MLPSSYAVMDEEEMTYVEGGVVVPTWVVGGAINVAIGLLCGSVSGLCAKAAKGYFYKASARKMFARNIAKKLMAKGIACSVASAITGSISTVLTFVGGILDPGNYIARYYDRHDKKPNNGWCDI